MAKNVAKNMYSPKQGKRKGRHTKLKNKHKSVKRLR